jgi:peptidoglycan/LPS O-acetylase OafA/YrhL
VVYWIVDGARIGRHAIVEGQPWRVQVMKLGLSLAAAMVSWHLIEQPILRWKDRFNYRNETRESQS